MIGYLRRHWRGEFPLVESFWGNYFLISLIVHGLLTALSGTISGIQPDAPNLAAGLGLASLVARAPIWVWQVVGVWRSAQCHVFQTRKRFWARLSQGVMIFSAASIVLVWPPLTVHLTKQAFGLQEHDDYRVSLLSNGTELSLSGGIGRGLAEEVERYLVRHPDVGVIHLDSPGGDVHEARRLRDVIVDRQLVTYVRFRCHSACALAFTGGRERIVHADAVLGFHRPTLPDFGRYANWVFGEEMQEGEREVADLTRRLLQGAGVSQAFIRHVLAVHSPKTWFPAQEELLQAGVITGMTDGSEFYPPDLLSGEERLRDHEMDERRRAVEQDPGDADAWRDLGDAALDVGELEQAEATYTRFIALVQERADMQALAGGYRRLGHVYGRLDRIEQAEAMYRKSLEIATESGDTEASGKAYLSLGWVYRSRDDFAQAEEMYEKSLAVAKEAGDKGLMGVAYVELGAVQQGRDDQRQAESMYRKALSLVTEVDDKEAVARAYARLARLYGDQGDSTRAEKMYGNTLALAKEIGDRALVGEAGDDDGVQRVQDVLNRLKDKDQV